MLLHRFSVLPPLKSLRRLTAPYAVLPVALVATAMFALPRFAYALFGIPGPGEILKKITNGIFDGMLHLIEGLLGSIAGLIWDLSEIGARFLTWILTTFNSEVGFVGNPFVQNGWVVVRDVANWFFIVFLMVAAFGTVLNIPRYNARQVLPALIIIALLINFSLFLTGFFINVSQTIMILFVQNGVAPYGDVGLALHNGMKLGNLQQQADAIRDKVDSDIGEEFAVISLYLLNIALAGGSAFIFFFLAIIFIVRVIILWVYIIISPLAFAARILPRTQQFFTEWLDGYFNWTIFGIIATFFIWLATWLAQYMSIVPAFNAPDALAADGSSISALVGIAGYLMQYITIFIFLWLAVKFSRKFAGMGATIASGAIAAATVGTVLPATARTVAALRQSRYGGALQGAAGRAIGRVGTIPVLGTITGAKRTSRVLMRQEEETRARQAATMAGIGQMTNKNAGAMLRNAPTPYARRKGAEALAQTPGRLETVLSTDKAGIEEIRALQRAEKKAKDGPPIIQRATVQWIEDKDQREDVMKQMRTEHYGALAQAGHFWTSGEGTAKDAREYHLATGKWEHISSALRMGSPEVATKVVSEVTTANKENRLSPDIIRGWNSMVGGAALGLEQLKSSAAGAAAQLSKRPAVGAGAVPGAPSAGGRRSAGGVVLPPGTKSV